MQKRKLNQLILNGELTMLQNLTFIFHNPYTLRVYSSEKPKATIYTYGFIIDFIQKDKCLQFKIQSAMSATTAAVYLGIPSTVSLAQFTNVQRGTIFMWFVTVLIIVIVTGVRLLTGNLDPDGGSYEDSKQGKQDKKGKQQGANMQSSQAFEQAIYKSQVLGDDDSGTVRMMKKITKFSTVLVPLTITFALGFVLGVTYAFSFVLYFLILIPLILFNLLQFHKWMFDHKAFLCVFDNIWIIATFFWLLNMWTTGKFEQPYYMVQWYPK